MKNETYYCNKITIYFLSWIYKTHDLLFHILQYIMWSNILGKIRQCKIICYVIGAISNCVHIILVNV